MKNYKEPDPDCGWCLGTGIVDSGGFTPWDAPIDIPCSCTYMEDSEFPINWVCC